jgi:hypothetical protein
MENVAVRTMVWAAALGVGALAAVLLGVSMLAASQTTSETAPPPDLMSPPLVTALLRASKSVPAPPSGTATVNVPCQGKERVTSSRSSSSVQVQWELVGGGDYQRSTIRQARCLARHGFLSRDDLASIVKARPTRSRHGLGRVVPLSLQLDPSSLALSGWGLLVGMELAAAALFIHAIRRESRRPGSFSR